MVAFISRLVYPDPAANALETIQMAAAVAVEMQGTGLFVHDLSMPEEIIREQYGIEYSPLRIWSMHSKRWPSFIYNQGQAQALAYNSAVGTILALHPAWRQLPPEEKIIFVRSRLEILYWGLMRPFLLGLHDWLFVCEIHDLQLPVRDERLGLYNLDSQRASRTVRALHNYDLVLTVTRALAKDIRRLAADTVDPLVLPLCSGLPRGAEPVITNLQRERVVLGYIGTVDLAHGVADLLDTLALLPDTFILRLVGRIKDDARQRVEAAVASGRVELVAPVPYSEVAAEIDRCDIALIPAGHTIHATKYRSPLKLFDYMARGKPIIAADVPCHRELLQSGYNAIFYRPGDTHHLAHQIQFLSSNPELRLALARAAYQMSSKHTYAARARHLRQLMDDARTPGKALGVAER